MTLPVPCPRTAIRISAIRIAGNDNWMSTTRMMIVSNLPPKYAAVNPADSPMISARTVLAAPTDREMRNP